MLIMVASQPTYQRLRPRREKSILDRIIPAFLASAAGILPQAIFLEDTAQPDDLVLRSNISEWTSIFGTLFDPLLSQQSILDRQVNLIGFNAQIEGSLSGHSHRAAFLAASLQHSGNWLFALPLPSCDLKLDDII